MYFLEIFNINFIFFLNYQTKHMPAITMSFVRAG
jgi:hypothetical protein